MLLAIDRATDGESGEGCWMTVPAATSSRTRLTKAQFLDGVFAGLRLRGIRQVTLENARLDRAIGQAYEHLSNKLADSVEFRFRIKPNRIHGDSSVVRDYISSSTQFLDIGLENPVMVNARLTSTVESARQTLRELPVEADEFMALAEMIVAHFGPT